MNKNTLSSIWLAGTAILLMWPFARLALKEYACFVSDPYWRQLLEQSHDPVTLPIFILHFTYAVIWFIWLGLLYRRKQCPK